MRCGSFPFVQTTWVYIGLKGLQGDFADTGREDLNSKWEGCGDDMKYGRRSRSMWECSGVSVLRHDWPDGAGSLQEQCLTPCDYLKSNGLISVYIMRFLK